MPIQFLRRVTLCTIGITLFFATAASAEPGVTETSIVIGMSAPFHGIYASVGQDMRDAIRANFDEVNAAGGIHGRKLELDSIDDDGEPARAAANTKTLLSDHEAFALIGYYGDAPIAAAMPIVTAAKIPLIGVVSGADALRRPVNRYLFHVRAGYNDEIAAMVAQFVSLRLTRIAVLYQNDALGKANAENFSAALKKYKLAPAALASVEPQTTFGGDVDVSAAVQAFCENTTAGRVAIDAAQSRSRIGAAIEKSWASTRNIWPYPRIGSDQLAQLLGESGRGIGISQVMPYPWDNTLPIVKDYQRQLGGWRQESGVFVC